MRPRQTNEGVERNLIESSEQAMKELTRLLTRASELAAENQELAREMAESLDGAKKQDF